MNILKLVFSILAILLGAFFFVFSEFDDSPGGQLIGLIIGITGIIGIIKTIKESS
tara:strand:+ start:157 stop:321 length:165 start_codon:yes stop_codon:yes gene_type:complete